MLAEVGRLARAFDVDVDLLQMLAGICGHHHRERHRELFPHTDMRTADLAQLSDEERSQDDELVSAHRTPHAPSADLPRAMTEAIAI